jgi:hypothetical protein
MCGEQFGSAASAHAPLADLDLALPAVPSAAVFRMMITEI